MMLYYRIAVVGLLFSMISGCHLIQQNDKAPIVNDDKTVIVEQPPKLVKTDWQEILSPLVDELLKNSEIDSNNQLLISDVKNSSNSYISATQINKITFNLLNKQTVFNVMDKTIINQAKQTLGIPYDDTLVSRSKMIALARNIKADYVLFTTITQAPKLPDTQANVAMELLLVKTGGIVWQNSLNELTSNQLVDNQTITQ